MTLMSKLTTQHYEQNKQFKPKLYQGKRRGQMRNFYDKCNYDQRSYQNRYRSDSRDRRISFSGRLQYGWDYRDRPTYEQNYRNDFRRGNLSGNVRTNQTYRAQSYRGGCRRNYQKENYERGRSRSRERQYQENTRRNDSSSSSRSRSGLRASTNRDRIRYYKCREYNHFAKDCPTSESQKEVGQTQQMFNVDEEQTSLKTLATDMYDSLNWVSSINEKAADHLNL